MYIRLALASAFVFFAIGCNTENGNNENTSSESPASATAAPPQSILGDAGTQKLMTVVENYYALKDALVATDAVKTDEAANKLRASSDELKTQLQTDSAHDNIISLLDTVSLGAQLIVSEKDETTDKKRVHFEKVSDAMFVLLKQADLKNAGVYRQYCPMAFNDKGAYWLSNETEIRNPYFGKKMLECGEVTDSLK